LIFDFCEFDGFYAHYKPLTPYGVMDKMKKTIYKDKKVLQKIYHQTSLCINFSSKSSSKLSKVEYHLKKIPHLDYLETLSTFESVEIFQLKKFLVNYKAIFDLLSKDLLSSFNVNFDVYELYDYLNIDGYGKQEFYISSAYSDRLKKIREDIKFKGKFLSREKKTILGDLLKNFKLDFRFRDFLIVHKNLAKNMFGSIFLESYDNEHFIAKPIYSENYNILATDIKNLVAQEKHEEKIIEKKIQKLVSKELKNFLQYIETIKKVDISFARARFALEYSLTKPQFIEYGKNICLKKGIFYPLMESCQAKNLKYTPLNIGFDNNIALIYGSNMGGKSVLLKTVLFMQICVQMGFFAPAEEFNTPVFDEFFYIGEDVNSIEQGLSSFGFEINSLVGALKFSHKKCFFFLDEFAKATNSKEARALLNAIVKYFFEKNLYSLISTHTGGLKNSKGISTYKMMGLNRKKYRENFYKTKNHLEIIRQLNHFMEYRLIKSPADVAVHDALEIAKILGLNSEIIENAKMNL